MMHQWNFGIYGYYPRMDGMERKIGKVYFEAYFEKYLWIEIY